MDTPSEIVVINMQNSYKSGPNAPRKHIQVLVCPSDFSTYQHFHTDGVCFDLDDTLWLSQVSHYQAMVYACEQMGYRAPSWEIYVERSVRQGGKIWDVLEQEHNLAPHVVAQIRQCKDEAFMTRFAKQVPLRADVESFLNQLRHANIRIAIVTSARAATINCFLKHAWRGSPPDVIVGHDDVLTTKPDPLIYQTAAARLGIDPANLLAIEDSPAGIESAQRAGMRCIGLLTEMFTEHDLRYAEAVAGSFAQIKLCDQA